MSSQLPHHISRSFSASDLVVFTGGGCHIFADALCRLLPDENYSLRAVNKQNGVHHVYAYRDGFMVDALGIKREEDYLAHSCGQYEMKLVPATCTSEALLKPVSKSAEPDGYEQSEMGLCVDAKLLAYLRAKAELLIWDSPERYRLSCLDRGRQILGNGK